MKTVLLAAVLLLPVNAFAQAGYSVELRWLNPTRPGGGAAVRISIAKPYNEYVLACELPPLAWDPPAGTPPSNAHVMIVMRQVEPYGVLEWLDQATGKACRTQWGLPPWPFSMNVQFFRDGVPIGASFVPVFGRASDLPPAPPMNVRPTP